MEPFEEAEDDEEEEDSTPFEPFEEAEDDEDEYSIPDHHFDIKTSEGKVGKMKGVIRERVSLIIQSHVFRKRRQTANGAEFVSCTGCEKKASKHLSAVAKIKEEDMNWLNGLDWKITRAGQMGTKL